MDNIYNTLDDSMNEVKNSPAFNFLMKRQYLPPILMKPADATMYIKPYLKKLQPI